MFADWVDSILMSFIGNIGTLMKGTGLEDLFAEVYAEHRIVHMIKVKAISRVLRAHILTELALMTLLLTECIILR